MEDSFFPWEREQPPVDFFTPVGFLPSRYGHQPGITVLTPSSTFARSGLAEFGIVSAQTPYGQGNVPGFKIPTHLLRRAVKEEVVRALECHHPAGKNYRPHQPAGMDRAKYDKLMHYWERIIEMQTRAIHALLGRW